MGLVRCAEAHRLKGSAYDDSSQGNDEADQIIHLIGTGQQHRPTVDARRMREWREVGIKTDVVESIGEQGQGLGPESDCTHVLSVSADSPLGAYGLQLGGHTDDLGDKKDERDADGCRKLLLGGEIEHHVGWKVQIDAKRMRYGVKVRRYLKTGRNPVWKNGRMEEDRTCSLAGGSGKDNKSCEFKVAETSGRWRGCAKAVGNEEAPCEAVGVRPGEGLRMASCQNGITVRVKCRPASAHTVPRISVTSNNRKGIKRRVRQKARAVEMSFRSGTRKDTQGTTGPGTGHDPSPASCGARSPSGGEQYWEFVGQQPTILGEQPLDKEAEKLDACLPGMEAWLRWQGHRGQGHTRVSRRAQDESRRLSTWRRRQPCLFHGYRKASLKARWQCQPRAGYPIAYESRQLDRTMPLDPAMETSPTHAVNRCASGIIDVLPLRRLLFAYLRSNTPMVSALWG